VCIGMYFVCTVYTLKRDACKEPSSITQIWAGREQEILSEGNTVLFLSLSWRCYWNAVIAYFLSPSCMSFHHATQSKQLKLESRNIITFFTTWSRLTALNSRVHCTNKQAWFAVKTSLSTRYAWGKWVKICL